MHSGSRSGENGSGVGNSTDSLSTIFPLFEEIPAAKILLPRLGPGLLSLQKPPEESLQIFDEAIWTERATGAPMGMQQVADVRGATHSDEATPVGHQRQERSETCERIVHSIQMRASARPRRIPWLHTDARANWVTLNLPRGREQMLLIHHEGMKTFPPKMPPPVFEEDDPTRVSTMCLAQRVAQDDARRRQHSASSSSRKNGRGRRFPRWVTWCGNFGKTTLGSLAIGQCIHLPKIPLRALPNLFSLYLFERVE